MEKRRNCSLGAISPLFHNIFNISLTQESNYIFIYETWLSYLFFLKSANPICRGTDLSKYFRESLGLRDNESGEYFKKLSAKILFWYFKVKRTEMHVIGEKQFCHTYIFVTSILQRYMMVNFNLQYFLSAQFADDKLMFWVFFVFAFFLSQ